MKGSESCRSGFLYMGNGYTKLSVRDNDKKNHWGIDTLDGYRESDTSRFT